MALKRKKLAAQAAELAAQAVPQISQAAAPQVSQAAAVPQVTAQSTPADYVPSDQVQQDKSALEAVAGRRPGEYTSSYAQELEELYDQIMNRPDFSYDLANDPLYQQYRQQYQRQGRLAMADTMGQAAALTGGYGSSYSQAAGQQSYHQYLAQLAEVTPQLYGQALDRYTRQGEALQAQYDRLLGLEERDYQRYAQAYSQWLSEYGLAQDRYESSRAQDYQAFLDLLNYWQQEAQRQQAQENWQAEMDFDREKWEASQAKAQSGGSSGGSSRGSSSRSSSSSAMTDSQAKAWAESYLSSGNTWAIGSAALEDWMAQRGITGQAAETFLAALRQAGYGQRTGGGGRGGPEKNRVNMLN